MYAIFIPYISHMFSPLDSIGLLHPFAATPKAAKLFSFWGQSFFLCLGRALVRLCDDGIYRRQLLLRSFGTNPKEALDYRCHAGCELGNSIYFQVFHVHRGEYQPLVSRQLDHPGNYPAHWNQFLHLSSHFLCAGYLSKQSGSPEGLTPCRPVHFLLPPTDCRPHYSLPNSSSTDPESGGVHGIVCGGSLPFSHGLRQENPHRQ